MAGHSSAGFDASTITDTIRRALASAGIDRDAGPMQGAAETIDRALAAAGLMPGRAADRTRDTGATTIDSTAHTIDEAGISPAATTRFASAANEAVIEPAPASHAPPRGDFRERSFTCAAGTRRYKVYLPAGYAQAASAGLPMVVMLHGCTQTPDDFAAGTRMNALADEHGFIVVYPAQCASANAQKCWNWFRTEDQIRESGEPVIIAGLTREVAATHGVDPQRIFVAGLSAGAAMAVVLGATYPDLYAAVGAHSGLAYGVANDMSSALAVMRGGTSGAPTTSRIAVPTIVFHGDRDHTVHPSNATSIMQQATARSAMAPLRTQVSTGTAAGGRSFRRTAYRDDTGRVVAEQWSVNGAGHAWAGGSTSGSFTDARGPDASREMVRFFLALAGGRRAV